MYQEGERLKGAALRDSEYAVSVSYLLHEGNITELHPAHNDSEQPVISSDIHSQPIRSYGPFMIHI